MPDVRPCASCIRKLILEHSKHPRNYRVLTDASSTMEGFNPLCGDRFTIYLKMDGDNIQDIGFQGSGCAISKSSASVMTQTVERQDPAGGRGILSPLPAAGDRAAMKMATASNWESWRSLPESPSFPCG